MATNKNYSITLGALLDTAELSQKIKNLEKQKHSINFTADSKGLKEATEGANGLGKALDDTNQSMENNLLTFQAANMLLSKTVDVISSMVDQVYELNGAVTDFKKVSDLEGSSLDSYVEKLSGLGKDVARTKSEMVEAATEFKKSGFSDDDSAVLAQVGTMYQNVADEAITAGDAAGFIIAQMKAFNIEAGNATHIIDAVNLFGRYRVN